MKYLLVLLLLVAAGCNDPNFEKGLICSKEAGDKFSQGYLIIIRREDGGSDDFRKIRVTKEVFDKVNLGEIFECPLAEKKQD